MPPQLDHISALIFDFDGTLATPVLDFSLLRERALASLTPFMEQWDKALEGSSLPVMEELDRLCASLPPSQAALARRRCMDAVEAVEIEAAGRAALFPFVRPMLRALRAKGYSMAIVTRNCPEAVFTVFPDLADFCSPILTRKDVHRVKPHPDHMNAALKAMGASPEATLAIGDHPMDVEAGKRVGVLTAAVLTGESSRESLEASGPDMLAKDASQVARLLGADIGIAEADL